MLGVSERIVTQVAEAEDSDSTTLPPLYEVIDPDALDKLIESLSGGPNQSTCVVRFVYCDYEITVTASGKISLVPA